MELKILENVENKTLGRRDVTFQVVQAGPAKRSEVHAELCKALNLKPEGTIIIEMKRGFGEKQISCIAHSYETKEQMESAEPAHLLSRAGIGEDKTDAGEEAPAKEEKADAKKDDAAAKAEASVKEEGAKEEKHAEKAEEPAKGAGDSKEVAAEPAPAEKKEGE